MKKLAVFLFVFFGFVGCNSNDIELLQQSLHRSIELNERTISEKNSELKFL